MSAALVEAEGLVHAVNHVIGGDFTLCGDAYDLGSDEPGYEWKPTKAKAVTCPNCAAIIRSVQGLRTYVRKDPS